MVRNGRAQARKLTLSAGTVELNAPRVNDRRRDEQGRRQRFTSRILPPYLRRSPKGAAAPPPSVSDFDNAAWPRCDLQFWPHLDVF